MKIYLFAGEFKVIDIQQKSETLHFGLDFDDHSKTWNYSSQSYLIIQSPDTSLSLPSSAAMKLYPSEFDSDKTFPSVLPE